MPFSIQARQNYLDCDISGNLTAEGYCEVIAAAHALSLKTRCKNVLVTLRDKDPQFTLVTPVFREIRRLLGPDSEYRIAIVADSRDLSLSVEYGVLVGGQHGIATESFRNTHDAVSWLIGSVVPEITDKRAGEPNYPVTERRQNTGDRRQGSVAVTQNRRSRLSDRRCPDLNAAAST